MLYLEIRPRARGYMYISTEKKDRDNYTFVIPWFVYKCEEEVFSATQ